MRTRTAVFILCAAATLGAIVQCGGGSSPTGNPTPVPTVAPTATPTPGTGLPAGMVCSPTPPPLYGMQVKMHDGNADRAVLDSKPLVVNTPDDWCGKYAGKSGRFCETRQEGDPQRTACDYMAVGQASNGRWGPSWFYNDKPCDGANFTDCANIESNQFLAAAKSEGRFEACAASTVPVDPDGGRCGGCTFASGQCK